MPLPLCPNPPHFRPFGLDSGRSPCSLRCQQKESVSNHVKGMKYLLKYLQDKQPLAESLGTNRTGSTERRRGRPGWQTLPRRPWGAGSWPEREPWAGS